MSEFAEAVAKEIDEKILFGPTPIDQQRGSLVTELPQADFVQVHPLPPQPETVTTVAGADKTVWAGKFYGQLKLVEEFHPLLKTRCKEVTDFTDIPALAREMVRIMEERNGVGLSGNQVGRTERMFVMRQLTLDGKTQKLFTMVNPELLKHMGTELNQEEGCLSFPLLRLKIKRSHGVLVRYQKEDGTRVERDFWDVDARCFQHELEHMDGIRMIDKVSSGILTNAREKQRKLAKKIGKLASR